MARLLPLIVLLMIPGVCCQSGWDVNYSSSHICALKGSTVTINCTYKYPTGHHIRQVFWTNTLVRPSNQDFPNLFKESEYRERIQYLGDKQHDCSVRLNDVRHTDSHKYYFRFITDKYDGKWIGIPGVTLNITDNPVISISSSGVIVEGDSVTLTCNSESNPPVHNYSWFKEKTFVGSGNIYIISNITSDLSGQYKCKTSHTCGEKYSEPVILNVLYRPRNVTASISSSGVIVEGDSVNLTCSSESNPPVHIYSWFKENQSSSVGSGQTFSISNFNSSLSGWFYCVAQNEIGSQRSDASLVTVHPSSYGVFGITAACGGLLFIAIIIVLIWFMMRNRRVAKTKDAAVNQQDDQSRAIKHVDLASESANCDDVQYESVKPQRLRGEQTTARKAPESRDPEELQYATVHYKRNTEMRRSEENKNHYGNITNHKPDPSVRSNEEDTLLIYSSVAMVMSIIMTPPPLIFLLMIHGVYSADDDWSVTYSSSHICALKNSTVTINCTYKYPTGHNITEVFWTKSNSSKPPNLFNESEYRERIQYLGDKQHDCSVRLNDVRHTDSHEYYFRFITDKYDGKWIGNPGVTLDVTDLQVESEGETVMEGHSVTLTCKSRCSLTDISTFIWLRNRQTLNDTNKKLILPSVRRENAGDYRCAVQGHKLTSPPRRLNVFYPPDDPVISISSSDVIVEGDSVTLTCISESNPPANIRWFKEKTFLGSGNIYIISNIRSDHSGEYKCKARNKHGHKYSAETLNVLYPPRNVSASISSSGVIVEGDSVTLTCISESNPPVHIYSWFKENQTSSVGSGQSFRAPESGWFYCVSQNEVGSQRSAAFSVTVKGNVMFYTIIGGALVSGSAENQVVETEK
ncbi:B-cell receptor CD22-like [Triplophysa dalaica]|uniref:B-cell receptor CD22-like n=1 Tax=Triplophysa dalaica TaxID=1582913 RepID=UPI0024E01FA9|nr:B-cell receptor CD22-like [Triplophysa dalaica]